jgi:hypothetical protein
MGQEHVMPLLRQQYKVHFVQTSDRWMVNQRAFMRLNLGQPHSVEKKPGRKSR